jgi:hypothetical protein
VILDDRPRTEATGSWAPLAVDEHAARRVAACFLADDRSAETSLVRAAYDQLVRQTDELLGQLMRRWPSMQLSPTEVTVPYETDDELIEGVRTTGVIEIPRGDRERRHALLGCEPGGEYDRFRALHDLVGHVLPAFGFDRDGEFSAWCLQHRHYRGLARWALATELHVHHSVRWTSGELADPKAMLVDRRLLRASLAAATAARGRGTPPIMACKTRAK